MVSQNILPRILIVAGDCPSHPYACVKLATVLAELHDVTVAGPNGSALSRLQAETKRYNESPTSKGKIECLSTGDVTTVVHCNVRPVINPRVYSPLKIILSTIFNRNFYPYISAGLHEQVMDDQAGTYENLKQMLPEYDIVYAFAMLLSRFDKKRLHRPLSSNFLRQLTIQASFARQNYLPNSGILPDRSSPYPTWRCILHQHPVSFQFWGDKPRRARDNSCSTEYGYRSADVTPLQVFFLVFSILACAILTMWSKTMHSSLVKRDTWAPGHNRIMKNIFRRPEKNDQNGIMPTELGIGASRFRSDSSYFLT